MRFNKQELMTIASQPSQNFDKEGILLFKEKQDGFFRRTEICVSRWYRLRGNLLFYFRGPEQWSEPIGVIVLENHSVQIQKQDENGQWPFQIVFEGGICYKFATYSSAERNLLVQCIQNASYNHIKTQLLRLKQKLECKISQQIDLDIQTWRMQKRISFDLTEVPLCELALSCDNLLCYPHGRPPSPMIMIHVKYPNGHRIQYATTEVIESCSNPSFAKTIMFRGSDGLTGDTLIQITVYDIRERISQIGVPLGFASLLLSTIQDTQRLRITLSSHDNKTVGFVTINGWRLEPSSTNSSPRHTNGPTSMDVPQKLLCHKRSHSLPPRLGVKLKLPMHGNLMKYSFTNSHQVSYRFHSGLGGDITVHEIMAESKLCFQLPIQLLNIYVLREMELLQEILSIGELDGKWKFRQSELLNTHLFLLKHYSIASQSMKMYLHNTNGRHFKESSRKDETSLEFAPVNLHLQRMWAYNDTLNKCGFHDVITVGAFAAHTHKAGRSGGLLRLLQQIKDVGTKVSLNSPAASRVQMASDAVQAIKQLRNEILIIMGKLHSLAKMKQSNGMLQLAEDMVTKTRTLLTLWDPGLVEEALSFIEWHKVSPPTDDNISGVSSQTNQTNLFDLCHQDLTIHSKIKSDKEPWMTFNLTELFPSTPVDGMDKPFGESTAGNPGHEGNADNELQFHNDHFNSNFPNIRHQNGLDINADRTLQNNELLDQLPNNSQLKENVTFDHNLVCRNHSEHINEEKQSGSKANDFNLGCCDFDFDLNTINNSYLDNWYQSSEEPEPWDLTQLNIEASVMCLVSKVKFLCGRCGSPAVRLRHQKTKDTVGIGKQLRNKQETFTENVEATNRTASDNQINYMSSSLADTDNALVAAVDSVKKLVKKGNKFTEGLKLDEVNEWSDELQPSMRKLKQAMDGLLKTGRLAHAVLRLKCEQPHRTRALTALQIRRDTCFSQALASVTTGLMCWLWTAREDIIMTLVVGGLGPLCGFEGLLSLHGSERAMWGDMVVAVEDLQTVVFTLTKSNHSTNIIPHITGSRCALTVHIPVSDSLYARFGSKECLSFTVTAVFFNVGINEKATMAEDAGETMPQEQSNADNFDKLNKYYHNYKKIFPTDPATINRTSSKIKPLEEVMENLRIIINKKIPKNYEILQLAALATRHMNGVRFTSCKSAKDRTGMSSTLEACTILASDYHLAEHEFTKALDVMRSEGCRFENTVKNIGVKKYAFNKVQIASLPKEYRPPAGTYGSTQT